MSTDDELDRSRMTEPADSHLPAQGDSGKVYAAYIDAECDNGACFLRRTEEETT